MRKSKNIPPEPYKNHFSLNKRPPLKALLTALRLSFPHVGLTTRAHTRAQTHGKVKVGAPADGCLVPPSCLSPASSQSIARAGARALQGHALASSASACVCVCVLLQVLTLLLAHYLLLGTD